MLVHLSVRDLAIIESLDLSLEPGMTALTGETGAGKSIILGALSLLLGERARADVIRSGCDSAEVAAQMHLSGEAARRCQARLAEQGLPTCDDGALIIRRVLSRAGRHRQFINGSLATVAQLREVMGPLVDLTGQHAHQALLQPTAQLDVLDGFAQHGPLLDEVAEAFARARALFDEQTELRQSEADRANRLDWLRYQLDEIDEVRPEPGEEERLADTRRTLMNVEKVREQLAHALDALEGDRGALGATQFAAAALSTATRDDPSLRPTLESIEEAAALLDDAVHTLQRHGSTLEADPARLAEVDDRLDAIRRLCRKHGGDCAAVLEAEERMQAELDKMAGASDRLEELALELESARADLAAAADRLRASRRAASKKLGRAIQKQLRDLGMAGATLECALDDVPPSDDSPLVIGRGNSRRGVTSTGSERVRLLLAANAGEPPQPLAKVASGGELSRVLLAVKQVLQKDRAVPLSIFDEVDAGVGGAIGEVIGEKLHAVSSRGQVLCVTHLPQIAALADHHLRVEKATTKGRTVTDVATLDEGARVEEVARMLGGKTITDQARAHAKQMRSAPRAGSRRRVGAS